MRFSSIYSLFALSTFFVPGALAQCEGVVCCSECPACVRVCIDNCVAEGNSETFCARGPCTGVAVSKSIHNHYAVPMLIKISDWMRIWMRQLGWRRLLKLYWSILYDVGMEKNEYSLAITSGCFLCFSYLGTLGEIVILIRVVAETCLRLLLPSVL